MRTLLRVRPRPGFRFRLLLVLSMVIGGAIAPGQVTRLAAQEPAMRWDGRFELVSGHADYPYPWSPPTQPADGPSRLSRHATSGDGRYVVFESDATNLLWYSSFSGTAVYRRDRRTGQIDMIQPMGRNPALSADGNHLAFEACEPWLRPDSAPICDVWTVDLRDWRHTPVSVAADGSFGDSDSSMPVLSADGRFVVFVTKAGNLVGGAAGTRQIVLRDRDPDGNGIFDEPGTGLLETITVDHLAPASVGNADSDSVEVSDDGRFVAFRSLASNLVPSDTNERWDVFLRDRHSYDTRRLNMTFAGQSLHSIDAGQLSMSADGRYVAFASTDPMLAPASVDDTNNALDVFLYDRQSFSVSRIDVGWSGDVIVPGNGPTSWPTLSADGRYVALQSTASNVETPPLTIDPQVYVVDRALPRVTRVSVPYGGGPADAACIQPTISRDGSLVVFLSLAWNLVPLETLAVAEQVYAAVHLEITPSEVVVPGRGGSGSFNVTTQQHTMWYAGWEWGQSWVWNTQPAYGVGSGSMTFEAHEPNPNPTQRSMTIRVGGASAIFTQDVGLSVTSVSPGSGPMSGGTTTTIRGTGFEPGMFVHFGGSPATVQFVDSTTILAVTSTSDRRGLVPVGIATQDGRFAWLDNAFLYLDSTPPEVWGGASGNPGQNGWFTGDVYVGWSWWDPESEVTSTTCQYFTLTTDTPGTTYTCNATSEGGTGTASVVVKRDATPPTIAVTRPLPLQLFELNSAATSEFTCADATSGVADCGGGQPSGSPIDTTMSGWLWFGAGAMDQAGNFGGSSVEYAVSRGYCAQPPQGLQTWLRFDGDLADVMSGNGTLNVGMPPDSYVEGESGQAYRFVSRGSQSLEHWHDGRLNFTSAMSVAMWLKPGSATLGTLVKSLYQFRLERTNAGAINWMLIHPGSTTSFGTSTGRTPLDAWSHVVFTYNAGEVKIYINGRLDRTWTVSGPTLQQSQGYWNRIRIGGPDEFSGYPYVGAFDELQLFDRAIDAGEIENIFLSGASGLCAPAPTVLDVPSPITTTYGAGTYPGVAILRDADGQPLAGKTITLYQEVSDLAGEIAPTTTRVTDENGMVRWDAPFDVIAGSYQGFKAYFAGDLHHAHSQWVIATVNVEKATPVITWATPAPITYGTALSFSAQLNATANVAGSMSYSPGSGSVPAAGIQTLTANFSPTDYRDYQTVSASVTLEVNKALPTITATGGTFTYDGQPHAATASATEYRGLALTPVTITYNGSSDAPVAPGVYTVVASYAGDANHLSHSVTTTLTIDKATPSIVFSTPTTVTYDGQPHGLTATAYGVGGMLGTAPVTYNGAPDVPVNAGVYTVSAAFAGDANHVARTVTTTLQINPATPTVTVTGGPFTYDAQPHDAVVTVTGIGGEVLASPVTVTYDNSANRPVDAGSYAVSASVTAAGNYATASGTGTLTIQKAAATLSVVGGAVTFDHQPHAATASATGVTGESLGSVTLTYNGNASAPVNAGSYAVVGSFAGNNNYEAATGTATLTIAKAPVTLTWPAPATLTYSNPLTSVQLNAGATSGGSFLGGTFVYTPAAGTVLDAGVHTLSVAFTPFDANYESGTAATTLTVRKYTPGFQISGNGTFPYDGQPHAVTASVIGAGGASLTPVTVTYNGSSSAPVNAGSYETAVGFAGDANHEAASITVTVTIGKVSPTLSWSAPGAIIYGTPLGAPQLNATANVAGTFLYSPAAGAVLGAGAGRPLSATFTPADTVNYTSGSIGTAITVSPAPLVVRASDAVKTYGASLPPFGVTFSGFVNGDSPASLSGALAFATSATATSPVGAYPIAPSGLSSANYAITFLNGALTIVKGAVAVSVSTSPEPSGYELPMTFTATVTPVVSAPTTPQGTVRFFDGTTLIGTATLANGTATLTTAGLDAGTRTIEARYDGDASFDLGTGSASHVIRTASATPVLSITSSRNPSTTGQSVTLTANISMSSGSVTGTIAFYDGGTLLGSSPIASGRATLTTTAFAAGSHAITARFLGSATAPPSVSPVFVQAVGATGWKNRTTAMSVTASANPSALGDTVTFTATVTASQTPAPAGSILFMVDGQVVSDPAGVPVSAISSTAARASLAVSGLAHGRHRVSAIYLGNSTYKGSAGNLTQTVN